jgi:hypothetical protein
LRLQVITVRFRKLDVPPIHLPPFVTPPWSEPEIILLPDPPLVGSPGQFYVELSNPLSLTKTVTVKFSAADFGAGIAFTPEATKVIDLPPNSFNRYGSASQVGGGGLVGWTGVERIHRPPQPGAFVSACRSAPVAREHQY